MEQLITDLLQIFSLSALQTHAEVGIRVWVLKETPVALNYVLKAKKKAFSIQGDTEINLIFY